MIQEQLRYSEFTFSFVVYLIKIIYFVLFRGGGGSPGNGSPTEGDRKRFRRSQLSREFKVGISYAAKIPLKSITLALQGSESEQTQEALRVLDIILRQQQAKRSILH